MTEFSIRSSEPNDREWISNLISERWGSDIVVVHDTVYTPAELSGFVAIIGNKRIGLITYLMKREECEIVSLDSLVSSIGVGSGLVDEVRRTAQGSGCRRLWVTTTNDNIEALRFYQGRGFTLVAIHKDAVERAREKKSQIPQVGLHDIPIKDEIELEIILD
jgi:DNA-3-methyladenine glycosylase I